LTQHIDAFIEEWVSLFGLFCLSVTAIGKALDNYPKIKNPRYIGSLIGLLLAIIIGILCGLAMGLIFVFAL